MILCAALRPSCKPHLHGAARVERRWVCRHEVFGRGEYWRLRDHSGKPPGLLGWWPSRTTTFLEVRLPCRLPSCTLPAEVLLTLGWNRASAAPTAECLVLHSYHEGI